MEHATACQLVPVPLFFVTDLLRWPENGGNMVVMWLTAGKSEDNAAHGKK